MGLRSKDYCSLRKRLGLRGRGSGEPLQRGNCGYPFQHQKERRSGLSVARQRENLEKHQQGYPRKELWAEYCAKVAVLCMRRTN